jgi:ribosomal protein L11 methylase PrmA
VVRTELANTVVNVGLAIGSGVACLTSACVRVYAIRARAVMSTRLVNTVVDVGLAVGSGVACLTSARVRVYAIRARPVVRTGLANTVVDVGLAVGSGVACLAGARGALLRTFFFDAGAVIVAVVGIVHLGVNTIVRAIF